MTAKREYRIGEPCFIMVLIIILICPVVLFIGEVLK